MSPRRHPRRLCRRCKRKLVKKAEHVYCGVACFREARRWKHGPCVICMVKPVSRQSRTGQTCGRSCGNVLRWQRHAPAERRKVAAMQKIARANFLKRLAARLKDEAEQLAAAKTPEAIAQVLARIYRKGYANGASATYHRLVTVARKKAS